MQPQTRWERFVCVEIKTESNCVGEIEMEGAELEMEGGGDGDGVCYKNGK